MLQKDQVDDIGAIELNPYELGRLAAAAQANEGKTLATQTTEFPTLSIRGGDDASKLWVGDWINLSQRDPSSRAFYIADNVKQRLFFIKDAFIERVLNLDIVLRVNWAHVRSR